MKDPGYGSDDLYLQFDYLLMQVKLHGLESWTRVTGLDMLRAACLVAIHVVSIVLKQYLVLTGLRVEGSYWFS